MSSFHTIEVGTFDCLFSQVRLNLFWMLHLIKVIWAEKYKLTSRFVLLALIIASSVVWVGETPSATERRSPQKPEMDVKKLATVRKPPKYSYVLLLGYGQELAVSVEISSIEEPETGAYWCGAPFFLDYRGSAKARIIDTSGRVEDEINLTIPSLVIGHPPNFDYYYYNTYEIDGDLNSYEFIVLDYSSCNGNWIQIVKADPKTHKFVVIPFQIDGEEQDKVLTGPNKKDLVLSQSRLITQTYDMIRGVFSKQEFIFNNGALVRVTQT